MGDKPPPREAANGPQGSPERVVRLQWDNAALAEAVQSLTGLQEQMSALHASQTVEQTLDALELLLERVVDYTYLQVYLRDYQGSGGLVLTRRMCPEGLGIEPSLIAWALESQEVAILPLEAHDARAFGNLHSTILLPLPGHREVQGLAILWLDQDTTVFTQGHTSLLGFLGRETASALEALQLQGELEDARARLAEVVEAVPLGLLAIDGQGRLSLINGTAEVMFGLRRAESLGQPLASLLPQAVHTQVRCLLQGERTEDQLEAEIQLPVVHSGETETFAVSVVPLRASNPAVGREGHLVVCRDLRLSREVAKLRELDAMKNDFLSLVSHELRTPLTSIIAYSETLLMDGIVDSEEERREYLQTINSEGERLSRLINDVLDVTKLESGKMDYSYEEVDLGDQVRAATATVQSLADQKSIRMLAEGADELPVVRADPDRIMQVLTNLYSNAIKFSEEGRSVTTRCRIVRPDDDPTPAVEVAVTDQGIGIAPEDLHKVFSKFEQIEKIDHHAVGTGLGMPICKLIIEEGHAGRIWLESTPGEGTTVSFRIPVT